MLVFLDNVLEEVLANNKSPLETLSVKGGASFIRAMQTNRTVRSLTLTGPICCGEGVQLLAEALAVNRSLESLRFNECDFQVAEWRALGEGLKIGGVNEVYIWYCFSPMNNDYARALAEGLRGARSLRQLMLHKCGVYDHRDGDIIRAALLADGGHGCLLISNCQ